MTAGGSPRARAVEVAGDDEGEQQRPAAATVVVHAVVNGSSGVDAATTPMLGDQKDPTTKYPCLLYTSPSPRDGLLSRMPSSA